MLDKLRQWNDDQRQKARARADKNMAQLRSRTGRTNQAGEPGLRAWVKANRQHRRAELAGVHLFTDKIVRLDPWPAPGGEEHPVAGVAAKVDNVGEVSGRATLTRTAVPGAHGWQKKVDTRETWLVIDGPGFQWTVQVPQAQAGEARRFAAAVTSAGRAPAR